MLAITKGPEPPALAAYRAVPGAAYDGKDFAPVKDEIRGALLRDQRALCCYCMRRISRDARPHPAKPAAPPIVQMKVEHWLPQSRRPDLQLAWTNLLGACLGGEGSAPSDQTCDTRKGENPGGCGAQAHRGAGDPARGAAARALQRTAPLGTKAVRRSLVSRGEGARRRTSGQPPTGSCRAAARSASGW